MAWARHGKAQATRQAGKCDGGGGRAKGGYVIVGDDGHRSERLLRGTRKTEQVVCHCFRYLPECYLCD